MRPGARWVARADNRGDGWTLAAPEQWDAGRHLPLILEPADAEVLVGLDVPVGLPLAWAERAGITAFRDLLGIIASGAWPTLLEPATSPDEISARRPFYPRAPGGARRDHLVRGLDLASPDDLLRRCDRAVPGVMGPAASVFWLVGPQQVGKAAISAWREVIAPCAAHPHVRLWPADGYLADLMNPGSAVICESYPRAAYEWPLGFPRAGWSKRRQADRRARARDARAWLAGSGMRVDVAPAMSAAFADGFGPAASGEDAFDATMGALQLIAVLEGRMPAGPPADLPDARRAVEGWIIGRPVG